MARWIGFGLVWVALVILSVDGVRSQRQSAAQRTAEATAV